MRSSLQRLAEGAARKGRAFARATGASVAIEFAFTVPLFITLSIGILYVGLTFLAMQHLETIAENAAYQVMVNNKATGTGVGTTQADLQNYVCNNLSGIFGCSKVFVDLQAQNNASSPYPQLNFDASNNVTNTWVYTPPATGAIMRLSVFYLWPAISLPFGVNFGNQPDGSLLIMSVQVFKVEPP